MMRWWARWCWPIGAVLAFSACGGLTAEQQQQLQQLQMEQEQAQAEVDYARTTPDPADDVAAGVHLATVTRKVNDAETTAVRAKLGPVVAFLSAIPYVGPVAASVGAVATALVPFGVALSKRQRKHWKDAVVATAKGRLPTAMTSLGKAYGLAHSNEASKAAAEVVAS